MSKTYSAGVVTAYGAAKAAGYTGTYEEFCAAQAELAEGAEKLATIERGAQVNVIETVKVNGSALTPDQDKAVNVPVPTKTSDLNNDSNFPVDANYVHTDNNFTDADKTKLSGIAAGAQVNVIETVKVNGSALTPSGKAVDVTKSGLGLGNVDNTSDANKPVSTATQTALNGKANKAASPTAGHVAAVDANGNLVDNGNKYNPYPKDETMPLRVGVDANGRLWASGDSGSERFGVKGVGGASTTLTRLWDAVGLTSTPGTDQTAGSSGFDIFPIFSRRKCVGSWSLVDGKAKFTVQAYEGDADYAEDGSMGDYVAVDVPPLYWYHEETTGTLGVSGGMHPGWEPHPICLDKDGNVREHTFLPVYALAMKNDHAVSLPGYDNFFGNYKNLWDAALTYGDGSLSGKAIIEPSVVDHYEWLLQTIEFATTNMQTVINGAVSMAYNTNHTITAAPAANKIVLTASIGDQFVLGQTIYIGSDHAATPSNVNAYNHITAIEKCDADGTLNASGTYRLITYDGTDRTSSITPGTTKVASRPWITGATAGFAPGVAAVQGHTGSPVSNSNGKYPFRYRWRENVFGNQNMTCLDLFDARTSDSDSYHLDWYFNDQLRFQGSSLYYPSSTSKPDLTDLTNQTNGFRKLTTITAKEHYADGYIKEEGFDADLPCVRVPTVTGSPASATAYYADYANLVNTIAVRAVRRRGALYSGASFGPRYVFANYAPSYAYWYFGAALYMAQ